ncbi:MAG: TonB-dependent receptor [Gammaproteobacteria bacterium]
MVGYRRFPFVSIVTLAAVLYGLPGYSQTSEGRITGTVRDELAAPVQAATVKITNQATNATSTITTSSDGTYSASLPAGAYSVTVTLLGFAEQTRSDLILGAGATVTADFTLALAGVAVEITVTALKREALLHEVPFSVAAPTEDILRDRGADTLEDVAANVGGFTVQSLGPGQSQVAMRGISAGQIVRDQPGVKEQVGVYLDESVISLSLFTPDLDLFDVNRVEVLRGPQGTLFGSGSLSGTVRYISNQPALGVTEGFAELGGGVTGGDSPDGNVKFGYNAPISDTAAVRAVGYYNRIAGFIGGVQPNLSIDENVNSGNRYGTRVAVTMAPNDRFTITPRFVYQKMETDGWNRIDEFNILANQFTTTRPAVTIGEREDFVQLQEDFTDDFVLADVNVNYNFGNVLLTSITSYVYRDVLVIRDATSLTASITGGSIGLPEEVYTLDAPLFDATTANVFTEELRLSGVSGASDQLQWVGGVFFSHTDRDYGQDLPVIGFEDLTGIPTEGLRAPKDSLFWSELGYKLDQFALFGEGTLTITDRLRLTGGLRFYHFSEDKEQIFDGIFGNDNNGTSLVSQPGSTDANGVAPRVILSYDVADQTILNAQVSKGFRLGGINDPLNVPLCTPEDLATFDGRETWEDETTWNYEVGAKSRILDNRGSLNVAFYYMDISDLQATVTAGSCSSRLIFNVPDSRSTGLEVDFDAAPNRNFDFAISTSINDSSLQSTVEPTAATGIVEGRRLPTVPEFQFAAAATYQWQRGASVPYVTATYQHVGDRYTQVGDQDLGTLDLLSFGANTIGAPLTQDTFTYDPKLPSYDILNLRFGVRRGDWDLSFYANNLTDERALLAFDRERGTRARIFFLTNQPRSLGVTARLNF